jgi:antitoxin HigA-1
LSSCPQEPEVLGRPELLINDLIGKFDGDNLMNNGMRPIHPGEILREEFLEPLDMSVNALARELRVDATRMNDIVRERRRVTSDTALRLSRFFGTTPEFWMNLQRDYDLKTLAASEEGASIRRDIKPRTHQAA